MSTGTTLVEELEREARSCESRGTYYTTSPTARVDFMARAARLRQRAARVRELAGYVAQFGGFASGKMYERGWTNAIERLTGPDIPVETAPKEREEP